MGWIPFHMKSRHRKYFFFFEHVLSFSRILPVGITLRSRFSTTEESQPHLVSVIPVSFVKIKKKKKRSLLWVL